MPSPSRDGESLRSQGREPPDWTAGARLPSPAAPDAGALGGIGLGATDAAGARELRAAGRGDGPPPDGAQG